jgi:4-carboxymuconolactone decarboxylase
LRGANRAERMRSTIDSGEVGSTMTALAMEFVFGRVWARGGLDRKQRSLVTIGILIALRQTDELKNHVHLGLRNGLSTHEIEEAIIQAAAYAGFPAAHAASNVLIEVLESLETDSTNETPIR